MALMVVFVGLLMAAQGTLVLGIRGLPGAMPQMNSTTAATNTTNLPSAQEQQEDLLPALNFGAVQPEKVRVEDTTADDKFSTQRVQMEQNGWSCSGGFSSQAHAWHCSGRSVY
jgi:hypothetical protein